MNWRSLASLGAACVVAACAIPEPPPGGPEDKTPPSVVASVPENGATRVPTDAEIVITFSERMKHARLERNVVFYPPVTIGEAHWKKDGVVIEPVEALHPDTTYVVELKPGFADAHDVRSTKGFRLAFATSAEIDSGSIEGRVLFRRKPTPKGVVRLFALPRDSTFKPEAARPDREVPVSEGGEFRLEYLPAGGRTFVLWAFEDANANGVFDAASEVGASLADTVALEPARPGSKGLEIAIVDPKEPAEIAGRVFNRTEFDTLLATVTMKEISDTARVTYLTRCSAEGEYKFGAALKGRYVVRAFMDLERDSICGTYVCPQDSSGRCAEPCVTHPDTVQVQPGDRLRLDDLVLGTGPSKGE